MVVSLLTSGRPKPYTHVKHRCYHVINKYSIVYISLLYRKSSAPLSPARAAQSALQRRSQASPWGERDPPPPPPPRPKEGTPGRLALGGGCGEAAARSSSMRTACANSLSWRPSAALQGSAPGERSPCMRACDS